MRKNPVERRLISQIIWMAIHRLCQRRRRRSMPCPHSTRSSIKTDCSFRWLLG